MNDIFALVEGMNLQGGKYTIVRMLSHGGFGVTYLAHHNLLDVDVCIKEFFPAVWCNRDAFSYEVSVSTTGNVDMVDRFMQKFIKEAQSIARLHHEGIVKFHDVFEENGTAYYVMDFIEGQTLQQLVKDRGALPLAEAIGYIRQAAAALGYLHGKRMNHLDVKPANMMIDHSGKLTLIDFGVAKHYGEDGHQTTTTPMCISRGYSPIEQYKDGGVSQFSPAADIYPLGATLYYLLTGTVPPEATELAVDKLIIPDTIPTHIAEAIRHTMESKPSRRTPSAAAFVNELGGKTVEDNVVTKPVSKPRPRHEGSHVQAESDGMPKKAVPTIEKKEVKDKNIARIVTIIGLGLLIILIIGIIDLKDGTWNKDQKNYSSNAVSENYKTQPVDKVDSEEQPAKSVMDQIPNAEQQATPTTTATSFNFTDALNYLDGSERWERDEMEKYSDLRGLFDDMNQFRFERLINYWGPKLSASKNFALVVAHAKNACKNARKNGLQGKIYDKPTHPSLRLNNYLRCIDP